MAGGFQVKEVGNQTSSPRTTSNRDQANSAARAEVPYDKMPHTSFGIIVGVHEKEAKVQVQLLGEKSPFAKGSWLPVTQSIESIYVLYGQLRIGMPVRVFWQGKTVKDAKHGFVDILADETADLFVQKMHENEVKASPYKFTGGGLTSFA